jgi:hypothetical protein
MQNTPLGTFLPKHNGAPREAFGVPKMERDQDDPWTQRLNAQIAWLEPVIRRTAFSNAVRKRLSVAATATESSRVCCVGVTLVRAAVCAVSRAGSAAPTMITARTAAHLLIRDRYIFPGLAMEVKLEVYDATAAHQTICAPRAHPATRPFSPAYHTDEREHTVKREMQPVAAPFPVAGTASTHV